jgi:hypothetical protein
MPGVALGAIWAIVGDKVGSGVGTRGVALGAIWPVVGERVGSGVGVNAGVFGSVVGMGVIACDWQAVSAAKTATSRKSVRILEEFFINNNRLSCGSFVLQSVCQI